MALVKVLIWRRHWLVHWLKRGTKSSLQKTALFAGPDFVLPGAWERWAVGRSDWTIGKAQDFEGLQHGVHAQDLVATKDVLV